jgi:hypothetical protein
LTCAINVPRILEITDGKRFGREPEGIGMHELSEAQGIIMFPHHEVKWFLYV